MGLFSDIYNTVAKFFRPQEETTEGDTKSVATNRLKLVLMQDRTNLTPKVLEQMRGELINLLSKYLEMDKDLLELNFEQDGNQVALMLSIPVIRAKDEDEIEALLAEGNSDENTGSEDSDEDSEDDSEDETAEDSGEDSEVFDEESEEDSEGDENNGEVQPESDEGGVKKPKRKRSKKVSAPEGLDEDNVDNQPAENSENQEVAASEAE